jgi:hypothetical protein
MPPLRDPARESKDVDAQHKAGHDDIFAISA